MDISPSKTNALINADQQFVWRLTELAVWGQSICFMQGILFDFYKFAA